MKNIKHAICVVAHPDDEVLWFASILKEVNKVIFVYQDCSEAPDLGNKRAQAIAQLPYESVTLSIPEAGTYDLAHWKHPQLSEFGLFLDQNIASRKTILAYEKNYYSIKTQLENLIPENSTVYTHNPWGEYGHADHVQVSKVLSDLRDSLRLTLKVSPYISAQSGVLAELYTENTTMAPERRPINSDYASQIADIYKRNNCWTWASDWKWDDDEHLLPEPQLIQDKDTQMNIKNSTRIRKIPSSVNKRLPT